MCSADKVEPVHVVEFLRHLGAEQEPRPSRADEPRVSDLFRVRPHHVAEGALVGDLLIALDRADLKSSVCPGYERLWCQRRGVVSVIPCYRPCRPFTRTHTHRTEGW